MAYLLTPPMKRNQACIVQPCLFRSTLLFAVFETPKPRIRSLWASGCAGQSTGTSPPMAAHRERSSQRPHPANQRGPKYMSSIPRFGPTVVHEQDPYFKVYKQDLLWGLWCPNLRSCVPDRLSRRRLRRQRRLPRLLMAPHGWTKHILASDFTEGFRIPRRCLPLGLQIAQSRSYPCTLGYYPCTWSPRVLQVYGNLRPLILSGSHDLKGGCGVLLPGQILAKRTALKGSGSEVQVAFRRSWLLRSYLAPKSTQKLKCSSCLFKTRFVLRDCNIPPRKGTTFKPLGMFNKGLLGSF